MNQELPGRPFTAEAEITSATTTTLVPRDGDRNAITVAAKERLVVTDVYLQVETAQVVSLYSDDDADAAVDTGELIIKGTFAANGGLATGFVTPHFCTKGKNLLKVVTATTGLTVVKVCGRVIRTN